MKQKNYSAPQIELIGIFPESVLAASADPLYKVNEYESNGDSFILEF